METNFICYCVWSIAIRIYAFGPPENNLLLTFELNRITQKNRARGLSLSSFWTQRSRLLPAWIKCRIKFFWVRKIPPQWLHRTHSKADWSITCYRTGILYVCDSLWSLAIFHRPQLILFPLFAMQGGYFLLSMMTRWQSSVISSGHFHPLIYSILNTTHDFSKTVVRRERERWEREKERERWPSIWDNIESLNPDSAMLKKSKFPGYLVCQDVAKTVLDFKFRRVVSLEEHSAGIVDHTKQPVSKGSTIIWKPGNERQYQNSFKILFL